MIVSAQQVAARWRALRPNTKLTVYHGTGADQVKHLINGFDANKVVYHHYISRGDPHHPGLFVSPYEQTAKQFGDVLLEIVVQAKNLHGTDFGGNIYRHHPGWGDQETQDWLRERYPDSFRPGLSYSLGASGTEPQALLRGLVRPSQIKRVRWEGKWYSRDRFLAEVGPSLHLRDLGVDLSTPNLTVPELFGAVEQAHRLQSGKAEKVYRDAWARGKVADLLRMTGFGPTAIRAYVRKLDSYFAGQPKQGRLRPQRTQAFVFGDGKVDLRLPVTDEVNQSDIRAGVKTLDRDVRAVLSALEDAGYKSKRRGWTLSMEYPSFSEQIQILGKPGRTFSPYSKRNLPEVTAILESLPSIAVASPSRLASRYQEKHHATR